MVVFLCVLLILIVILIILLMSNISITIKDMTINDLDNAQNIFEIILKEKDERKKIDVLDYISFKLKIQIKFLSKIPIFVLNLNNQKVKNILLKQYDKEIRKHKDIEQDKKKAKQFSKQLLPKISLEKTKLDMLLGTDNAAFTAIASSIINISIGIFLPYVANNELENYHYKVEPVYLDKNVFFLQFSCIITIKLVHIINVICKKEENKK